MCFQASKFSPSGDTKSVVPAVKWYNKGTKEPNGAPWGELFGPGTTVLGLEENKHQSEGVTVWGRSLLVLNCYMISEQITLSSAFRLDDLGNYWDLSCGLACENREN